MTLHDKKKVKKFSDHTTTNIQQHLDLPYDSLIH